MRNEWLGVPEVLLKKLFINAGVMTGVLITGDVYKRQALRRP